MHWTLVAITLAFLAFAESKKIPNYVTVCKKSDPLYVQCVRQSIEALKPRLAQGIPKMQVPPAEPFHIPELEINRDLEALKVKLLLKDISAYGGSSFAIDDLKIDTDKLELEASFSIPVLNIQADYNINGRLLVIPLRGKGLFTGNFTNTRVSIKGNGKMITKDNENYIQVSVIKSKLRVNPDFKFNFQNREKNDELITNTAASFVNANKKDVLDVIMPVIEETVDEVAVQFANNIFLHIPASEILPP